MDLFKVERLDNISWCEDYKMIVIAQDKLWAEKLCRMKSNDFKNAKLRVTKVDLDKEQIISIENTGA